MCESKTDHASNPDPYVTFEAGGIIEPLSEGTSTVIDNTITPVWDEIILTDVAARAITEHFCFQVMDEDSLDPDEISPSWCPVVADWHFSDTVIHVITPLVDVRYRIRLH